MWIKRKISVKTRKQLKKVKRRNQNITSYNEYCEFSGAEMKSNLSEIDTIIITNKEVIYPPK